MDVVLVRAIEPIDRILNAFILFCGQLLGNNGYLDLVINTIMGNSFLLVGISLLILGFVVGILSRLVHM